MELQVQVQNNIQQVSDSDETNNSASQTTTDSSLDTLSFEVIKPSEGHEIRLPEDPPQRAPPNSPESPRTNVAVPVLDDLLTEDEETGDQAVSPIATSTTPNLKGRQETLSPTPQVPQTVQLAIELTVKDFEPSEQRIIDKCGEVDEEEVYKGDPGRDEGWEPCCRVEYIRIGVHVTTTLLRGSIAIKYVINAVGVIK